MKSRSQILTPLVLAIVLLALSHPVAQADHEYDYFSDRLSREHRDAGDVDDWIERGSATVTASPVFENGIRLTAWASGSAEEGNYDFALASAVYFFEVPHQAQYAEILVRYRGEPQKSYLEDYEEIAGRVWIRNTRREYVRQSYNNDDGENETLYGDTFVLRAKRRSETLKIPTADHVDNGILELHLVADDGQQLDVEYLDVSTYRRQPDVRVIHRYARDYRWEPWYRYSYLYFYDGPSYYWYDPGYYIRWSYPIYDHHYISIRYAYQDYLYTYYRRYPYYHYHYHYYGSPSNRVDVRVRVDNSVDTRRRLTQWTASHEDVRQEYTRSRLSVSRSTGNTAGAQTRIRALIEKHRQEPALSERVIQPSAAYRRRAATSSESKSIDTREMSSAVRGSIPQSRTEDRTYSRSRYSSSSEYVSPGSDLRSRLYNRSSADTTSRSPSIQEETRSNAERREALYNRTKSYTSRSSAAPSASGSSSSVKASPTTRSRSSAVSSYRSSSSQSRTSTSQQTRSTSSSSQDDDEADKSDRSRNTERTKRRR
jgi:hypothetical protein